MKEKSIFLLCLALILGIVSMALEIVGFRILAPYFGYSVYVSGGLIGVIMISMSAGYYFGGRLCTKNVEKNLKYCIISATVFYGIFFLLYKSLLEMFMPLGEIGGSVVASIVLFVPVTILLSATTPMIIGIVSKKGAEGIASARVYSVSTIGSVIGVFLGTFVMIPLLGTKNTLFMFLVALVVLSLFILRKKILMPLALLLCIPFFVHSESGNVIYERDSVYNLVRVYNASGDLRLMLNQEIYTQSMYNPQKVVLNQYFDYFNLAPFLLNRTITNETEFNLLILGMGAGTSAHQYAYFYPRARLDAVEIDPEVIAVARQYFNIDTIPHLNAIAADARPFIKYTTNTYDIVEVDAYTGGPYAPFYILTDEFFDEIAKKTSEDGVLVVNMYLIRAKTAAAHEYLNAVLSTIGSHWPNLYIVPYRNNVLIFGTKVPYSKAQISKRFQDAGIQFEKLLDAGYFSSISVEQVTAFPGPILTDDNAPVEQYTHRILVE